MNLCQTIPEGENYMKDVTNSQDVINDNSAPSNFIQNIEDKYDASKLQLDTLGLTADDMSNIVEVKNSFGDLNSLNITEYGQKVVASNCTDELLSMVKAGDLEKTGDQLNSILTIARDINGSNLINQSGASSWPIIGKLFNSVRRSKENFMNKFNDTARQMENIVEEISKNQVGLQNRVEMLDTMHENARNDYHNLGVYVAAGQLKLQELSNEIQERSRKNSSSNNQMEIQAINDLQNVYANLEKRIHDLFVLQQSTMQTLPMIRIIQGNNRMLIDKFNAIKQVTIPAWKQQISLALSLNEQENSVKLANAIDDATNAMLRSNANLLKTNSIETAKANQRSVIDPSTLEYVQNTMFSTLTEVKKIHEEGVRKRDEATAKIIGLQNKFREVTGSTTARIASKQK